MSYIREAHPPRQFRDILYRAEEGVATITLNRPQAYNCYSTRTLEELAQAFRDAAWEDAVSVVVLTGAGERAFCTGGDVKEYERDYIRRPRDYWHYMALFRAYIESILRCPKPVIARLNGIAVGGGNESQLACDFAVAGSHVYCGQVGTGVGSVACGGSTQWLPLAVGDRRARRMLFLNEKVYAAQALAWGLVSEVVPTLRWRAEWRLEPTPAEIDKAHRREDDYSVDLGPLDEAVAALAARLREKFPECARYTKAQVNFWKELAWSQTVSHAQEWLTLHYASREPWEGMAAFVEKRPVDFAGLRRRWAEDRHPESVWGPPTATCPECGAQGLPREFSHCGACGATLAPVEAGRP